MANSRPLWAVYRALMSGRLIGLDKCPGVWPLGVGEIRRRMLGKSVLVVTRVESNEACRTEKLCGDLKEGIRGGSTRCSFCGNNIPRSRTGGSSSLMNAIH